MKKRKLFLISLFVLIFVLLSAKSNEKSKFELTEIDITTIKDFSSDKITVYGISLGMNQQEVSNIILKNKDIVMEDEKDYSRIRIFDKNSDGSKNKDILLFVWEPSNPKLSEIIIYNNFTKYLKGKTKLLLNLDILNPQSEISKLFLGNYDKSIVKADSKYFKSTHYYYNDKGLIIDHIIVVETESINLRLTNLEQNEKEQVESSKNYDFRKAIWGMNILQVKNTEKGKPIIEKDDLLLYKDEVAGLNCKIVYIFLQGKFVRAKYVFEESHTNKNDYISDFKKLKDLLTKKYGEPFYSQKWKNDLYKDDYQQWGFAVSLGHLVYFAEWSVPRSSIKLILQGENYKIDLQIEYSSKIYEGLEENQREKQQLDDF